MALKSVATAKQQPDNAPELEVMSGNCPLRVGGSICDRADDSNMFASEAAAIIEAVIHAGDSLDKKHRGRALYGALRLIELSTEFAESIYPGTPHAGSQD